MKSSAALPRLSLLCLGAVAPIASNAQGSPGLEERLRRLEQRQEQLERELVEKDARIRELETARGAGTAAAPVPAAGSAPAAGGAPAGESSTAATLTIADYEKLSVEQKNAVTREQIASLKSQAAATGGVIGDVSAVDPKKQDIAAQLVGWGSFAPGKGFTLAKTDLGEMNFSAYTQIRYVNQLGTDDTYTDRFGAEKPYDARQDITLNKVLLWFTGWVGDPKLRYNFSLWTSQALQGQTGNIQTTGVITYAFDPAFALSAGVTALPAAHTNMGNWPLWMGAERNIGDDYLKPGYTQGIWAEGKLAPRLFYKVVLGNNINTIGIDPGQLDDNLNTIGAALWWMPGTGEWGPRNGAMNDYEMHTTPATIFGVGYTHSREDRFSLSTGGFENFAIRLSDGTAIFSPGALQPNTQIDRLDYDMGSLKAGYKHRGLSVLAEYQWRSLSNFAGSGPLTRKGVWDQVITANAGYFVVPQKYEVYARGSYIFGELRDPWDFGVGVNWFPVKGNRNIRVNGDVAYVYRTPIGAQSYPWQVGMTGVALNANLEVLF
jgi:hypothetical protein